MAAGDYSTGTEHRSGAADRRGALRERVSTSLLAFSLVSLIFTGGYNWRRVDEVVEKQKRQEQAMEDRDTTYVRKDILVEQFKTMTAQLDALKQQLDEVKQTLREQRH